MLTVLVFLPTAHEATEWQWFLDGGTLKVCPAASEWGHQPPQQHGGNAPQTNLTNGQPSNQVIIVLLRSNCCLIFWWTGGQ